MLFCVTSIKKIEILLTCTFSAIQCSYHIKYVKRHVQRYWKSFTVIAYDRISPKLPKSIRIILYLFKSITETKHIITCKFS